MNTKQMNYILEVSRTLNFNQAARNLFISQPSLSYQIKTIEEEIGFQIFERNGKKIRLTPAGHQFCRQLGSIRSEIKSAIEQGQNFSNRYDENLTIGYPIRSCLYFLPEAIKKFHELHPETLITPHIGDSNLLDRFLNDELDILFATKEEAQKLSGVSIHQLFTSQIYLLVPKNDPLASKKKALATDITGRTLLVNGGSSSKLRKVQQEVLKHIKVNTLNSPTHDFTMVLVASNQAVCLTPGYLNDFSDELAWIAFDTNEKFECVLVTHDYDKRDSLANFINLLQSIYQEKTLKYKL